MTCGGISRPTPRAAHFTCGARRVRRDGLFFGVRGWHDEAVAGSLVSPVLVGRQAELKSLSSALEHVLTGEQVTVLVGGEAGVGKSRLVHELIDEARGAEYPRAGRRLRRARRRRDSRSRRWWRWSARWRSSCPPAELDAVFGAARGEIGRLVPELENDQPAAPAGERDASRLLELMLGVIGRLSARAPLMLVFEDVQWADSCDARPAGAARGTYQRQPAAARAHRSL